MYYYNIFSGEFDDYAYDLTFCSDEFLLPERLDFIRKEIKSNKKIEEYLKFSGKTWKKGKRYPYTGEYLIEESVMSIDNAKKIECWNVFNRVDLSFISWVINSIGYEILKIDGEVSL